MRRVRLIQQVSRGLVLVAVTIVLVFGSLVFLLESERYQSTLKLIERSAQALAEQKLNSLGHQLFFLNREGVAFNIEQLTRSEGVLGGDVFDKEGKLFYSSRPLPPGTLLPEPDRALARSVHATVYSGKQALEYLVAITAVGEQYGHLRLYYDLEKPASQALLSGLVFGCSCSS